MPRLLEPTDRGLYCAAGDFYIDPFRTVDRAVITHGHSDHARPGSKAYLAASRGAGILRERVGHKANIETLDFGRRLTIGEVELSFHPAGHVLGSAQIRVEGQGELWVVSGDYKTEADRTCDAFEPVTCTTFVTESTFALPVYRWKPQVEIFAEIDEWRRECIDRGLTSVISAYSLGKAQRVIAGVDPFITPIMAHPHVMPYVELYREAGIELPEVLEWDEHTIAQHRGRLLIVAPNLSFDNARMVGPHATASVSGWNQVRRMQRRSGGHHRGFVLSDHADWDGLLWAIEATEAEEICVSHGYTETLVRWLREQGKQARTLPTHFEYGK